MVMNFEHIATRIPLNVRVDMISFLCYNIGLKDYFFEGVTYG